MKSDELNPWTMAKLKESYCEVTQDDDQRERIVQQVMRKSTGFLRRIIVPPDGHEGATLAYVRPHCLRRPQLVCPDGALENCDWWCAACGGQFNWRDSNRVWVMQDSADPCDAKVLRAHRAHAPPQVACENLVCAVKAFGEPTDGWRQPCGHAPRGFSGDELRRVHRGGQPRGSE